MFAVAVIVIASAIELYGVRATDRNAVLAALDQRAVTGVPRHLDHDEGEELQAAVTAALAANPSDFDMASAAVRASFPILADATPVIYESMPTVSVRSLPPFKLPWKIAADVALDASVDGADWRHAIDLPRATRQANVPIGKLFPGASRPGFHAVRFRATLRFVGAPAWLPSTVSRNLSTVTYGITGDSAAGQRVAALMSSAARVNASDLDRALPQVPLATWLGTIARTPDSPPMYWTGQWCQNRTGLDDEAQTSICARAMVGASPSGGHAEVWIRIATVDVSGEKPTWTAVTPAVEGVDLIDSGRATGDLVTLPSALRSATDDWPHATLDLDARAITVSPATPAPGEPVMIAIELKNAGTSDVIGALMDVTVGDAAEGPALAHRQFVRTIPAGESVIVKTETRFPRGYGVISVLALPGAHGAFPTLLRDPSNWSAGANRFVRPELAPPGFLKRMTAAIGTPR